MAGNNLQRLAWPAQSVNSGADHHVHGAAAPSAPRVWWPAGRIAAAFRYLTGIGAHRHREIQEAPSYQSVHRGIAREFNRARRFERPLSVLVLRTNSLQTSEPDAVVPLALQRLRDTDLWYHRPEAGELVLIAPETDCNAAGILGRRVAAGLGATDGARVTWSTATFPEDGLTFGTLYEVCRGRLAGPAFSRPVLVAGKGA